MVSTFANPTATPPRSAGNSSELLDLRDTKTSEHDRADSYNNGSSYSTDCATPGWIELGCTSSGDGLGEALKAERRSNNHREKELSGLRQDVIRS